MNAVTIVLSHAFLIINPPNEGLFGINHHLQLKSILTVLVLCLSIGIKSSLAQLSGGSVYKPIPIPQSRPSAIQIPNPQQSLRSLDREIYENQRRQLELDILREQRNALRNQKKDKITSLTFQIGRINYLDSQNELTEWKKLDYKMTITVSGGLIEMIKGQDLSLYRMIDHEQTSENSLKYFTDKNTSFEIIVLDEEVFIIVVESPKEIVAYFAVSPSI
ncbi:hypothetical protein CHU00_16080 [Sphingobacterium cellulitidis]|uniref:hypothetical protein n=1 Tax=Sphingobacterium cellulitidis TaxID=1768011 RepID=UPI000B9426E2|nr:hypothetical protein [Sphingobacterium cellulitidis]OYD44633.1 hypothetical protein CHU00_16080 [Sphingobacterium cellulitidis]